MYTINPGGVSGGDTYSVYCDQTTDGGGWMLLYAYDHTGGENNALVDETIPTNPTGGYSHVHVDDLSGYTESDIQDVRFYCTTEYHSRVMHFKTSNALVKGFAFDGDFSNNAVSAWTSGYTALDDDDAYLPGETASVAPSGISIQPFYKGFTYHWSINMDSSHCFECDDYTSNAYTTLHQVWVRMAS